MKSSYTCIGHVGHVGHFGHVGHVGHVGHAGHFGHTYKSSRNQKDFTSKLYFKCWNS